MSAGRSGMTDPAAAKTVADHLSGYFYVLTAYFMRIPAYHVSRITYHSKFTTYQRIYVLRIDVSTYLRIAYRRINVFTYRGSTFLEYVGDANRK